MRRDPGILDELVQHAANHGADPAVMEVLRELVSQVKTQAEALDRLWPDWERQTTAPSCVDGH